MVDRCPKCGANPVGLLAWACGSCNSINAMYQSDTCHIRELSALCLEAATWIEAESLAAIDAGRTPEGCRGMVERLREAAIKERDEQIAGLVELLGEEQKMVARLGSIASTATNELRAARERVTKLQMICAAILRRQAKGGA